ncbi:MAG: AAA family ATPase, partial [Planctomycetales bacterium]|nr:AAA family ATPase [Planctomycetales bacterium]
AIGQLSKVADANQLEQQLGQTSDSLEMLIDVVSNLKIDDATQRTTIIEDISAVYAQLNQSRAALKKKKQELLSVEGVAEFHSQVKLLNQALVNYLDVCNSAAKCEEYLTKLMVQVEELEGRFAEFDDFVVQLGEKREEIYSAFESRKVALVESRNRRANALMSTAQRILKGLETRVAGLTDVAEIHAYFASDLMVDKVRDIVRQLAELEDSVKVDDIQSQLKTIREDAVRQLKDRQELFVDGENIIQLGKHRFTVNVQPLDLTIIRREQGHFFHLTGTNFLEQIEDPTLDECRLVWDQETVAENRDVYRAEYLAYQLLQQGEAEGTAELNRLSRSTDDQLRDHVHEFMASRHSEAYVKGVHDHDALKLLRALLHQRLQAGFLRYAPETRALVALFWQTLLDRQESDSPSRRTVSRIRSAGAVARRFPQSKHRQQAIDLLQRKITRFVEKSSLFDVDIVEHAAKCCFDLVVQSSLLPVGPRAARIVKAFDEQSRRDGFQDEVQGTLESLASGDRFRSLREWIAATTDASSDDWRPGDIDEATAVVLNGGLKQRPVLGGDDVVVVEGLVGDHPRLQGHAYQLDYSAFHQRLNAYRCDVVPRYQQYVETKHQLTSRKRKLLRLEEFHPRVLTSFVRNRLIDQVYLPLIGDNLAKQIGAAGDAKRTDLMGLLMLISPPGYGKTTLMEYVANRLGITFVKINGPAVGHQVRSLDPAEAPNASARQEVEKLNLSLEMGDNVMIYVDDIQHCHPEFLQKFISLCDAQRKIEGVYHGQPRTYDLRGRKVAVVMAGNPYTESGEKFQVPDMLANRADTYNLGDVIGDSREAFELSYLENAMTSNPVLSIIAGRSSKDLTAIIKLAQTDSPEGIDLEATYSVDELNEMVSVVRKLIQLRNVVLRVNQQYIQSAAQSAAYRTEPPFKLQGSYRDMNKLAERVVAVMNDDELQQLILSHYENQAQTLATDAEANLLKLRQLLGLLDDEQTKRWQEICRRFQRNLLLGSTDDGDRMTQVIAQMTTFSEGLHHIREALVAGARQLVEQKQHPPVPVVSDPTPPPAPQIQVPQIQVAYKVPKVFLEVIKAQFAVMDGWIQPFLQLSRSTQADTESLRQSVHQAMQAYSALIAKMEKANGDETEENA